MNPLFYIGMVMLSPFLFVGGIAGLKEVASLLRTFAMDKFWDRFVLIILLPIGILFIIMGLIL